MRIILYCNFIYILMGCAIIQGTNPSEFCYLYENTAEYDGSYNHKKYSVGDSITIQRTSYHLFTDTSIVIMFLHEPSLPRRDFKISRRTVSNNVINYYHYGDGVIGYNFELNRKLNILKVYGYSHSNYDNFTSYDLVWTKTIDPLYSFIKMKSIKYKETDIPKIKIMFYPQIKS